MTKNEINKYMTPSEAAYRWGENQDTVKNKLKPSKNKNQLDEMLDQGLIKFFKKPDGIRKEWIISEQAMHIWFPHKQIGGIEHENNVN